MPIVIPKDIPAFKALSDENIFVMNSVRADSQDIRPIEIAILNLMPTKIETEIQLMRLLGNTPLQVNITLVQTATYKSKNISESHLHRFYKTFEEIKKRHFDGMIITGAPVETLEFSDVVYWDELKEILEYADRNVTSTMYICWGAQAALNFYHNVGKHAVSKKIFGVFPNRATNPLEPLLKGVDDVFYIPNSRHTQINEDEVVACKDLEIIARSEQTGISMIKEGNGKRFYFMGHSEYDRDTLKNEYLRDLGKGLPIDEPYNYFVNGDLDRIDVKWRSTANIVFFNWLNYYVYQITPYKHAD